MENGKSPWPQKPEQVRIFRIASIGKNYRLSNHIGEFVGRLVYDSGSEYHSKMIRIVKNDGTWIGYVPSERVNEILEFIGRQTFYPCKGTINRKYNRTSKMYYFWGECIVSKSNV